MLWFLGKR